MAGKREVKEQRATLICYRAREQIQRSFELAFRSRPSREAYIRLAAFAMQVDQTAFAGWLLATRLESCDGFTKEPNALVKGPYGECVLSSTSGILDDCGGIGGRTGLPVVSGDLGEVGVYRTGVHLLDGFSCSDIQPLTPKSRETGEQRLADQLMGKRQPTAV